METKGFLFEILMNVVVVFFSFICKPMLWIYGSDKHYNSFSAEVNIRCQNMTLKDNPRDERVKSKHTL